MTERGGRPRPSDADIIDGIVFGVMAGAIFARRWPYHVGRRNPQPLHVCDLCPRSRESWVVGGCAREGSGPYGRITQTNDSSSRSTWVAASGSRGTGNAEGAHIMP